MLRELSGIAASADHVPAVAGSDALLYIAAVVLWLAGVVAFIARKLRAA